MDGHADTNKGFVNIGFENDGDFKNVISSGLKDDSLISADLNGREIKVEEHLDKQTKLESKPEDVKQKLPRSIRVYVYLSQILSTWGDRMWEFGVGLFMVALSPESLRLVAIYGFSYSTAVLLFAPSVGAWIDKMQRLKAARVCLVIQNSSVAICSGVVALVFWNKENIADILPNQGLLYVCYILIIIIAIVAGLASVGMKISLQRDWIVEICGKDKDMLASMSATLRRIYLTNVIVAPIATGQIMTFGSIGYGAIFIGGWNALSVFVEYFLLWKVFYMVPALRTKATTTLSTKGKNVEKDIEITVKVSDQTEDKHKREPKVTSNVKIQPTNESYEVKLEDVNLDDVKSSDVKFGEVKLDNRLKEKDSPSEPAKKYSTDKNSDDCDFELQMVSLELDDNKDHNPAKNVNTSQHVGKGNNSKAKGEVVFQSLFQNFINLYRGWKIYIKYDVAFAGLGLAALYMTVMGFDNITVGFAYSQGISESLLGVIMAAGGIMGIFGTLLYPIVRRRVGLERTGLFGLALQVFFLCFCISSIWAPGSPFDPFFTQRNAVTQVTCNITDIDMTPSSATPETIDSALDSRTTEGPNTDVVADDSCASVKTDVTTYWSIALFLTGLIGTRAGLWIADLSITQLFLETVEENERGIVNGVQNSLNFLMDILKFALVVLMPEPELFGILIILSVIFVCIGWALYAKYCRSLLIADLAITQLFLETTEENEGSHGCTTSLTFQNLSWN